MHVTRRTFGGRSLPALARGAILASSICTMLLSSTPVGMENLETRSPHEFDDAEFDDADEWRAGFSMAIMRAETDDSDQLTLDACFTIGTPRGSGAALSRAAAALLCPAMEEVVEEGDSGGSTSVALGVHSPGATVAAPARALAEEDTSPEMLRPLCSR